MGARFSSKNDFNKVLINQQRRSNNLSTFTLPITIQQPPLQKTLSIPAPVRYSPVIEKSSGDLPMINRQTAHNQSYEFKPIETSPAMTTITNPTTLVPPRVNIERSASFSNRSEQLRKSSDKTDDIVVVSRSVVNLTEYRPQKNSFHVQPSQSSHSIIERNGKKFSTEFLERTERRYVNYYDPRQRRTRVFEVVDIIPTKVIRPVKHLSQSQVNDGPSAFQSLVKATLPPRVPDERRSSRSKGSSPSKDNAGQPGITTIPQNNRRRSSARTSSLSTLPSPQTKIPQFTEALEPPRPNPPSAPVTTTTNNQKNKPKENVSKPTILRRSVTPSGSEYTAASSEFRESIKPRRLSQNIDPEQRYNTMYRTSDNDRQNNGKSSPAARSYNQSNRADPFEREKNATGHAYRPIAVDTYSQPIAGRGVFLGGTAGKDYAPIPDRMGPSNVGQYSSTGVKNRNGYEG